MRDPSTIDATMPSPIRACALALLSLCLSACANTGDRRLPIPTQTFRSDADPARALVVVLPGRWDDVDAMADAGIAQAIQSAWPEADVLLTGATLSYYLDGRLASRLHEEVIVPARARGYREIWLAGASMGGMGTLLYERQYPGELEGLLLLAPYLGDRRLLREIERSGGIAAWQPGPEPVEIDRGNYQRELWRHLQTWVENPQPGRRVWLAYGSQDRLRRAVPLFAPLIPDAQILERPGGHKWTVWVPAAGEAFAIAQQRRLGSVR